MRGNSALDRGNSQDEKWKVGECGGGMKWVREEEGPRALYFKEYGCYSESNFIIFKLYELFNSLFSYLIHRDRASITISCAKCDGYSGEQKRHVSCPQWSYKKNILILDNSFTEEGCPEYKENLSLSLEWFPVFWLEQVGEWWCYLKRWGWLREEKVLEMKESELRVQRWTCQVWDICELLV